MALAASAIALPSVAVAAGIYPHGAAHSHGRVGGNFRGNFHGRGNFGNYASNGYYGGQGYYGGYCGPVQMVLGLCRPWMY
jgi:hypothetical protein